MTRAVQLDRAVEYQLRRKVKDRSIAVQQESYSIAEMTLSRL